MIILNYIINISIIVSNNLETTKSRLSDLFKNILIDALEKNGRDIIDEQTQEYLSHCNNEKINGISQRLDNVHTDNSIDSTRFVVNYLPFVYDRLGVQGILEILSDDDKHEKAKLKYKSIDEAIFTKENFDDIGNIFAFQEFRCRRSCQVISLKLLDLDLSQEDKERLKDEHKRQLKCHMKWVLAYNNSGLMKALLNNGKIKYVELFNKSYKDLTDILSLTENNVGEKMQSYINIIDWETSTLNPRPNSSLERHEPPTLQEIILINSDLLGNNEQKKNGPNSHLSSETNVLAIASSHLR